MQMLKDIIDQYDKGVSHQGHSVELKTFSLIVKDLIKEHGYTNELFNKLTIILGGPTMPVTITDEDGNELFVLPGIFDASETLDFKDVLLDVNRKREEHMQGTGKPIEDIIGMPKVTNKEKWGLFFKHLTEATVTSQQPLQSEDDSEIED